MDWKQIYTTATQFERQQIAFMLLKHLQNYPTMPTLRYHFIGSRRKNKKAQVAYLSAFMFILATVSVATLLVSTNVPPAYGAPLVFFWISVLFIIFSVPPVRRARWAF
jgi:hypothetical protein